HVLVPDLGARQRAAVARVAVVVEDVLPVEVAVHGSTPPWGPSITDPAPSIRRRPAGAGRARCPPPAGPRRPGRCRHRSWRGRSPPRPGGGAAAGCSG